MRGCASFLAVVALTGCSTAEDPCDTARFQCDDSTEAFSPDEDCDLTGALSVELGQGRSEFQGLTAGQMPETFKGNQGGQHAFMGLRVSNAALDRYDKLRADFSFHVVAACSSSAFGTPVATTDLGEPGSCLFRMNTRKVVVGDLLPIRTNPDGAVEEYGILLQVPDIPDQLRVIELEVADPCGRVGSTQHVVEPR